MERGVWQSTAHEVIRVGCYLATKSPSLPDHAMGYQCFLNTENRVISTFHFNQIREAVAETSSKPIQNHSLEQVLVPTPVLELSRETEKIIHKALDSHIMGAGIQLLQHG